MREQVTQRRGQGGLRASHADRERVIELFKAAFVQDRLTKDELDMRVGRALAARTGAELVALTVDIPAGAGPVRPPIPARRQPLAQAAVWSGNCLAIAGAAVWAAFSRESLAGPMLLLALYAVLAALVILGFGVATSRKQNAVAAADPGPLMNGPWGGRDHRGAGWYQIWSVPCIPREKWALPSLSTSASSTLSSR